MIRVGLSSSSASNNTPPSTSSVTVAASWSLSELLHQLQVQEYIVTLLAMPWILGLLCLSSNSLITRITRHPLVASRENDDLKERR
jgi:hypothetical protein